MRRLLLGLACATLLLPACGDDDGDDDRAAVTSIPVHTTVTTSSTTTTTEAPVPPPDVIPADESQITERYVEQVLNALYEVTNRALLETMALGAVDKNVIRIVEATTPESRVVDDINDLMTLAADGFPGVREEPGPIRAEVVDLLTADRSCVFAEVRIDDSAVAIDSGVQEARTFVRLLPATDDQRSSGFNPTAWVIDDLPATLDGSTPTETCRVAS